jgi:electron transport complex protein RnfG
MSQKESTFKNMVVTLFVVTFVASSALGFVYEVTKGPKAEAERSKKVNAIQNVLPGFTNNPLEEQFIVSTDAGEFIVYPGEKNNELIGIAVETFSEEGYGGEFRLMVGILPNGEMYNVSVIEHKETPGLGAQIKEKNGRFIKQFRHMKLSTDPLKVKQDGGTIDGITAATITSRAFCDAVNRAYAVFNKAIKL